MASVTRVSTDDVPAARRVEYWEAYNASQLVGLRCSSYAPEGLSASQTNAAFAEDVRIADIRGNQHVIERTAELVRRHPKEALFACLLLEGGAFFYQGDRCVTVAAGDLLLYETVRPYLYGFTGRMRQLIVEVPREDFRRRCGRLLSDGPLHLDGRTGAGRLLSPALRSGVLRLMRAEPGDPAGCWPILEELARAGERRPPGGLLALLQAKAHIAAHLGDPGLDPAAVAAAAGLSVRHLNRLFQAEGSSLARHIAAARLERAHRELTDPARRADGIGDIAFRCGFADQAHFARSFRRRYGLSPSAVRAGETGA